MEKATFNTRKGDNNHLVFTPGSYYATGPPARSAGNEFVAFIKDYLASNIF